MFYSFEEQEQIFLDELDQVTHDCCDMLDLFFEEWEILEKKKLDIYPNLEDWREIVAFYYQKELAILQKSIS